MVPQASAANTPAITVGRVYAIEGDLFCYVPVENDWVAAVRDAPFRTGDTLYSGDNSMAEFIIPNGTWARIGGNTQIQFIALDRDLAEIDVAAGVVRFYNKSSGTVIKAISPFGYVLVNPGTVFDFYVGESSVEVVAVKGTVSFVHSATNVRYNVPAGSPSILADQNQVSSGEGTVDPDWDQWNRGREDFWIAKARVGGRSVGYLPPSLQPEAYALEENGRWESVPYEGTQRWFWRPTTVSAGWSPFTTGRWTDWDGDQTWIPEEPFGYVTHHYGNWIYARNNWYWAPPVVSVRPGLSLLNILFFWSPGRVSWIHSGAHVGWVPLAPRETYYSHRNWGDPHNVVVTNVSIVNINIRNYAYADRAIVIPRNDFYGVNNYRSVRVSNISPAAITKDYRAAPVVNNAVIPNYTTDKQRYNYTNAAVKEKPHNTVINRIRQNETVIQKSKKENAAVVQQQVKGIKEGKVNREARITPPKTTNYIVPVNQVNRPKSEMALKQKEIKSTGKAVAPAQPSRVAAPEKAPPARPGQPASPARVVGPEQTKAAKPAKPGQPVPSGQVVVPRHVAPARPGQPASVVIPQHTAPAKPENPGQAVVPEHVAPARPGKKIQVVIPEHATPAKPDKKELPDQVVVPRHTAPARPGQPAKVVIPQHAAPVKPIQPAPAPPAKVVAPQQTAPVKAPQPAPPARVAPQQTAPVKPGQPAPAPPAKVVAPQPAPPAKVVTPEPTAPAKPGQPAPPAKVVKPEHAAPAKPGQKDKPQGEPGQEEKQR